MTSPPAYRRRLVPALAAAACLLAACGGGISWGIGIGIGDDDDDAPRVSLSVQPAVVAPGGTFTLVADARDDGGVEQVDFFEVLPDGSRRFLREDTQRPHELVLQAPAAGGQWRYQAIAYDTWGQRGYSEVVTVTVQP